jgi:hypothetical protein
MAARRLLIVLIVLLAISVVATIVVPDPNEEKTATQATTTATAPATAEPAAEPIAAAPPPTPKITVGKRIETLPLRVGEAASLDIASDTPITVEIPALGLIEFADADAPAHFEILPTLPGTFPVKVAETGRTVAKLDVRKQRGA